MSPTVSSELAALTLSQLVERLARQLDTRSEWSREVLAEIGRRSNPRAPRGAMSASLVESMEVEYRRLGDAHPERHELLRILAADAGDAALETLARLLIDDPPASPDGPALALAPLFQRDQWPISRVFPRLLDALDRPALASVVLDLANFVARRRRVERHPAADHVETLGNLLGSLAQMLARVEDEPEEFAVSPRQLTQRIGESLALIVALCDALALIGDASVCGKLYQARELRHRRVRVEAGAALARLGDPSGVETLVEMTAEPVVRLRALAYLDELKLAEKAPEERRTPAARAAGALAAWLAEPMQFGVSPSSLEPIDQRRQFWPGYGEPLDCFLFRFEIPTPQGMLPGVGIAGPLLRASFGELPARPADDIYAFFAGSTVEHEAIAETPAGKLAAGQLAAWAAFKPQLIAQGYGELQLLKFGQFFEHRHWIAAAVRQGKPGIVVADQRDTAWYSFSDHADRWGADELYDLHKGRVLLATFNPPESA